MADTFAGLKEQCLDSPTDRVISKVKDLINSGVLKPGDKLPAERKMAMEFGFGRTQVREALHKLEFYGIIKTLPQSGSIINGLDITTLDGLISDVLNLQNYDFFSLVETRIVLEMNAIRLCAERRTNEDMRNLERAHEIFVRFFDTTDRISNDFAFHRIIAEASHNPVFKAMLMIVIPDIMIIYQRDRICGPNTEVLKEHELMLQAIKNQDGEEAAKIMQLHLKGVFDFAKEKLDQEINKPAFIA
jgi:GntR family transcriptional repressor for pyruvate dehydrogenase complex